MEAQAEQLNNMKNSRVGHLQKMLDDQRRQLLKKVSKHNENILTSKKYRTYKNVLQERMRMADNFIKQAADSFFIMMSDKEFLMLTTETDVIQKVEKFKKNIFNSLQKLTQNLDSKSANKVQGEHRASQSAEKAGDDDDGQDDQQQYVKPKSKSRHKSKNFKISNDASRAMTQWLLRNFQNPYPTTEQKQKMAKEGKISMVKVNNWFINARERTVKGYFQRDS